MSRAHLVPLALALLAGIIAGLHNVGLAALCLSLVATLLLRAVPGGARANDDEPGAVTLRLADGALATATLPDSLPAIGTRLVLRGKRVALDGPVFRATRHRANSRPSTASSVAHRSTGRARERAARPRDATLWLPRARARGTGRWFAARHSQTMFAIFEAFLNLGRQAHIDGGGSDVFRDAKRMNAILARPANVQKIDVYLSKKRFA